MVQILAVTPYTQDDANIWVFPEMGYPQIIHFNGIVPYKSSIVRYPHFRKPPFYPSPRKANLNATAEDVSKSLSDQSWSMSFPGEHGKVDMRRTRIGTRWCPIVS